MYGVVRGAKRDGSEMVPYPAHHPLLDIHHWHLGLHDMTFSARSEAANTEEAVVETQVLV